MENLKYYSAKEERINVLSHGLGLVLSLIALPLLIIRAVQIGGIYHIVSFTVYGVSLIILYSASTLFHAAKTNELAIKLNVFDHSSIFVLIAGTYTPYALVTLYGSKGWVIFGLVWGFALLGIISKFFFAGKYKLLAISMYILMGWTMIIYIRTLINNLSSDGLYWLLVGCILYTVGALFYYFRQIPFNHAIFHFFVLGGSICHFISIYFFVV